MGNCWYRKRSARASALGAVFFFAQDFWGSSKMADHAKIYLDESGDLGWTLDKPFRTGGSSRYLTIGAVVAADDSAKMLKRLVADLYRTRKWSKAKEKKWAKMTPTARIDFATRAESLATKCPEIAYHTITVAKGSVMAHIRADSNKLYNWMINILLVHQMKQFKTVHFIPDERSIKVKSGSSLHDYLQTELWFNIGVPTKLNTQPSQSTKFPQLQFADMLSGVSQSHFENGDSDAFNILSPRIKVKKLFF